MSQKHRKRADQSRRGGRAAFSHAPAVPGSEAQWRQYNYLQRDPKQEDLLRSKAALEGRVTYYFSLTPLDGGSPSRPRGIPMIEAGDLGIVLYLRGFASTDAPTYVDRKGITRSAGVLSASYAAMPLAVDTAHPYASSAAAASMFVIVRGLPVGSE